MKSIVSVFLMTSLLFGGGYWYYTALAGCDVPISYRVGTVDPRFNISDEEVRNAISSAESIWEDGTDRNLFTADVEGDLVINFVYDERQAQSEAQEEFETILDTKENMSETVKSEYENLVKQYETLRDSYEGQVDAYEKKLATYNKEVADWNARGGAPKDVFTRLEATQESLGEEEDRLNIISDRINSLVRKINALSSRGNSLVTDYNSLVEEYNDTFAEGKEFTQGDYQSNVINIYEFTNEEELVIVLAHEMGHALDIEHVGNSESLMYHHMKEQVLANGLTSEDIAAFGASCGSKGSMADTLHYLRETLLELLSRI
jgi:vacuolar-type H+-ATPase subunit I/STV1